MRELDAVVVTEAVKEMCIEANLKLAKDVEDRIENSCNTEKSRLAKKILGQLVQNMQIAKERCIPICQDTGMAVFFVKVGQDLHINGNLTDAINEGVRRGYAEGYLRKSVVGDPILRVNTKDNTPAIIHYDIVDGEDLEILIAPKGFGSENMSKIFMLKPADGIEGIKEAVLSTVKEAGPNACPPFVVGVGIGGDFELAAKLSKKALTRNLDERSSLDHIKKLEDDLLNEINKSGIGPAGLGGSTTALAVNIETYATHIAGMPVAVNMCCHVDRHVKRVL
ncbi:MAG: fumarate hydratase [Eubacterium sp.]|nr:fumarate hydratase [Eubacterium sp.]